MCGLPRVYGFFWGGGGAQVEVSSEWKGEGHWKEQDREIPTLKTWAHLLRGWLLPHTWKSQLTSTGSRLSTHLFCFGEWTAGPSGSRDLVQRENKAHLLELASVLQTYRRCFASSKLACDLGICWAVLDGRLAFLFTYIHPWFREPPFPLYVSATHTDQPPKRSWAEHLKPCHQNLSKPASATLSARCLLADLKNQGNAEAMEGK